MREPGNWRLPSRRRSSWRGAELTGRTWALRLPLAQRFFLQAFLHARSPADAGVTLQLMRLLESQLYGIVPHDAATLAAGLMGLLAAGGLAADLPARRAARLDTAAALRSG